MNTSFLVESSEHQAALELTPHNADYFIAEVRSHGLCATTRVGSYMSGGLDKFFGEMAVNWKGWSGERRWCSLESELALLAHSDRLGHVFLTVRLREGHPPHWEVEVALKLEAGQLEHLSISARRFESSAIRTA